MEWRCFGNYNPGLSMREELRVPVLVATAQVIGAFAVYESQLHDLVKRVLGAVQGLPE